MLLLSEQTVVFRPFPVVQSKKTVKQSLLISFIVRYDVTIREIFVQATQEDINATKTMQFSLVIDYPEIFNDKEVLDFNDLEAAAVMRRISCSFCFAIKFSGTKLKLFSIISFRGSIFMSYRRTLKKRLIAFRKQT